MVKKFEYMSLTYDVTSSRSDLDRYLNFRGNLGWECYQIRSGTPGFAITGDILVLYMKRQITGPEAYS